MPGKTPKKLIIYQKIRDICICMKPGTLLGKSIRDIAQDYQCNHKTVEAAIQMLKVEGYIEAKRGVGIRIKEKVLEFNSDSDIVLFMPYSPTASNHDLFIRSLINGIIKESGGQKICLMPISQKSYSSIKQIIKTHRIIGVIISSFFGMENFDAPYKYIKSINLPVCVLDHIDAHYDSIVFDDYELGRRAARAIFNTVKAKRVAVFQHATFGNSVFREIGFREELDRLKISHKRILWISSASGIKDNVEEVVDEYVKNGLIFDIAYVPNLNVAQSIVFSYRKNKIPDPFIVSLAMEDQKYEKFIPIKLNIEMLGSHAIRMIKTRISNPKLPVRSVLI